MNRNQHGKRKFSAIKKIIIILIILVAIVAGWFVYQNFLSIQKTNQTLIDNPKENENKPASDQTEDISTNEDLKQAEDFLEKTEIEIVETLNTDEIDSILSQ